MKKALDYVSDYQLESACKDAPCRASSRVIQKIFAVLAVRDHHVVVPHSFKLVRFYIYHNIAANSDAIVRIKMKI